MGLPETQTMEPSGQPRQRTVKVTFFTHNGLGQEAIHRHTETCKPETYRFKPDRKQIATGPERCVF